MNLGGTYIDLGEYDAAINTLKQVSGKRGDWKTGIICWASRTARAAILIEPPMLLTARLKKKKIMLRRSPDWEKRSTGGIKKTKLRR